MCFAPPAPVDPVEEVHGFTESDLDELRWFLNNPLSPNRRNAEPHILAAIGDYLREMMDSGMSHGEATLSLLELVRG